MPPATPAARSGPRGRGKLSAASSGHHAHPKTGALQVDVGSGLARRPWVLVLHRHDGLLLHAFSNEKRPLIKRKLPRFVKVFVEELLRSVSIPRAKTAIVGMLVEVVPMESLKMGMVSIARCCSPPCPASSLQLRMRGPVWHPGRLRGCSRRRPGCAQGGAAHGNESYESLHA